jgi:hypothetical protein
VSVNGDVTFEWNENFFVNLSNPTFAILDDAQGKCTIANDDPLRSIHDAYVRSDQASSNFGTATTLRARLSSPVYSSYLKFTVSELTGTVTSAKLRMKVVVASSSGGSLYSVSNYYKTSSTNCTPTSTLWLETGLNYNNAPCISGTPLSTVGSVTVNQIVEFDVIAAITGNGTYSFGLRSSSSSTTVQYDSDEATRTGFMRPELVITTSTSSTASVTAKAADDGLSLLSPEAPVVEVPEGITLSPNYPNPFNAQTLIEYGLPEAANVRLVIYSVLGQLVRTLVDENQAAGYKRVIWDAKNEFGVEVSAGVYFLQLNIGQQKFVRKMFLLR